jgi:hypothetical protein
MWQTFTPDGRGLVLRRIETGWVATCLGNRIESDSAAEAIRQAVGSDSKSTEAELEQWIGELVAELDAGS